jgi:hypothetical protein
VLHALRADASDKTNKVLIFCVFEFFKGRSQFVTKKDILFYFGDSPIPIAPEDHAGFDPIYGQ